ncbi:MAG: hypothetical protein WCX82_04890 [archaeon]|jgi:hypothetical protein
MNINKVVHFDEKEYLNKLMIEGNPQTPADTIKKIINDIDQEWHNYTFKLEVNKEILRCTIIDEQGEEINKDQLPILAKQYYYGLVEPYLFNR